MFPRDKKLLRKKPSPKNLYILYKILLLVGYFLCVQRSSLFAQRVQLGWTPSRSGILSHYRIYRSIHVDSNFVLLNTAKTSDSTYIDDDLQYNLRYYYVATAVDLIGNESSFSNMVDTTISIPVPVELSSFSVQVHDNDALLEWTTKTESTNYGFEVQRSESDPNNFEKIAFIRGHGTSSTPMHYYYVDKDLQKGEYFYRLKQIDFNGDFEFSTKIKITIGVPDEFCLEPNYPNPFNSSTTISYNLPKSSQVELNIYNVYGQIIFHLVNEYQKAGRYAANWPGIDENGRNVASGIYYFKIEALNTAMFRRMILIK